MRRWSGDSLSKGRYSFPRKPSRKAHGTTNRRIYCNVPNPGSLPVERPIKHASAYAAYGP